MNDNHNSEAVRRSIKELEPAIENMRQHMFLIKGVALGLFYGIIGNMLVSHYYGLFEGIVIWQFDKLFWSNLAILVIGVALVAIVSWRWGISLAKLEGSVEAFEKFKQQFLTQ